MVQFDFRLPTPGYVTELDEYESFNIILDSIQLYQEGEGEITYLPDDGTPDLPPDTAKPTTQPTSGNTDLSTNSGLSADVSNNTQTSTSGPGEESNQNNLLWIL